MSQKDVWQRLAESEEIIEFATTPARAFMLIAQLQLALRHPQNRGSSAQFAQQMIENLSAAICYHFPEAKEVIEMGSNAAYDVTNEYFETEF
ncbi:MAG: hypothetical protein F6J97_13065 [Leptolyngbya sp. SIO4C1]|nr:hypothetical protein [Leptolyngbya sp. SIO4C1]